MSVYLAVNGDGTKTECAIANDDRVLGKVTGESVLLRAVGAAEATVRLRKVLEGVSAQAGVPLYLVTHACVGLAGVVHNGVREWAEATLGDVLTGELVLTSGEEIAMEAAFGQGPGVLVFAGDVSSQVLGRCGNHSRFTAGGWGQVLGDEGSGCWIGLEGIRASLRGLDRGVHGPLLREMLSAWGLNSVGALIAKANGSVRPDFTLLVEGVCRCAAEGDVLAQSVLVRAGEGLAAQVSLVISKMRAASCGTSDVQRVTVAGSVLTGAELVTKTMVEALKASQPASVVDITAVEPILGALARARRQA